MARAVGSELASSIAGGQGNGHACGQLVGAHLDAHARMRGATPPISTCDNGWTAPSLGGRLLVACGIA